MTEEKMGLFEVYNRRTHLFGRIASIITLVLLLGAPFVIGADIGAIFTGGKKGSRPR